MVETAIFCINKCAYWIFTDKTKPFHFI